jgi:signal transduction histidine kinase
MSRTKILIVEDEFIVAEDIACRLEKLGYQVVGMAASGENAIEMAAENEPDLILMDIVLQGELDGINTAQEIKERFAIPVIFLTAYADQKTFQRAKLTEPFGYLTKPFQQRDLQTNIELALQRSQIESRVRQELLQAHSKADQQTNYVAMAAHELRNPLTTLVASARLLEAQGDKIDDFSRERFIRLIRSSSDKMQQAIDEILLLGQAENDQLSCNPEPLHLGYFCQQIIDQVQMICTEKHQLQLQVSDPIAQVNLDIKLMHHILLNLLGNSVKYSPDGGLICLQADLTEQVVTFKVKDQGIGIPAKDQDKIFQVFHRCSNVSNIKGTGLGLAIAKKSVEVHGGSISFTSTEGVGTTFTVQIYLQ